MSKISLFGTVGLASLIILGLTAAGSTKGASGPGTASPAIAEAVPNGTHFLVSLDGELSTNKAKVNKKFEVRTIEPLETASGYRLAPGAKLRGHISRIERGGIASRAALWLTFDDIATRHGRMPVLAEVAAVPGDFDVRRDDRKEGVIEARSRKTQQLEAAAGAALGAAAGSGTHGGLGAAVGGAAGGAAGFGASSADGQQVDLPRGTKLDLVLERPLYLIP
jgi:hypothetical protein